ncbi:NADH:ubiquinone reductase (Na(+)-transporting) subunit C [Chryseotalea sanaruensis]|uniref:Na(+)-translocating NADH-quinone reductase subunit C n=2 Tax=Chryseotalea sanaruensis TaxID=2482724 RepID=A0A401UF66_9BACT|nr:NADH:ubiquinone reductase (Na(+)-transporting) subunit C [Chryseotalea sanaruensis]
MYAAILTVVCGGLLAFASESLKEKQQENIALEQKENILSTVMVLKDEDNASEIYNKRVKAFVVDYSGNVVEGKRATDIDVVAEYKKPAKERLLPVYEFRSETDSNKIENVVLPLHGFGLWDRIWGYVALQADFNTIQGMVFQHKGETPGLGARIASEEIQDRYKGKEVFEGEQIASVEMMKGEGNDYASQEHKVDGMSGATLTAKGVNNMLKDYLVCYENYIKKTKTTTVL